MTKEHDLIASHFAPLASPKGKPPAFGLLDDTALVASVVGLDTLLTTDTLISGVHFFADDDPVDIAWKALAVNVSDIVAKGGRPDGYLLNLSLPVDYSEDHLARFASGLQQAQSRYGCRLLGGDTVVTPGPLTISISLQGEIPSGRMVRRDGAHVGDQIYCSGTIGDAALGLRVRHGDLLAGLSADDTDHLLSRYLRPQPRLELASLLEQYASAALDISDGLAGDFEKLCTASSVGGKIDAPLVPLSPAAKRAIAQTPLLLNTAFTGGDDYEALFTIAPKDVDEFEYAMRHLPDCPVTRIGTIASRQEGIGLYSGSGQKIELSQGAYDHFAGRAWIK
jgi:thiamine-monophosphate kinase